MDIPSIAGALNSVKIVSDLVKGGVALRDRAKMLEHLVELRSELLSSHERALAIHAQHSQLLEENRALKAKIAEFEKWNAEKGEYDLQQVAAGAFAYAPNPNRAGGGQAHWLCTACFERRKKSIMQRGEEDARRHNRIWFCPECRNKMTVPSSLYPKQTAATRPAPPPGRPCPKCGAEQFRLDRSEPDRDFGAEVPHRIYRCGACGFEEEQVRD